MIFLFKLLSLLLKNRTNTITNKAKFNLAPILIVKNNSAKSYFFFFYKKNSQ